MPPFALKHFEDAILDTAILEKAIPEKTMVSAPLAIASQFEPRVKRDEPMSRHTSWHVGGPADVFFTPRDRADLQRRKPANGR